MTESTMLIRSRLLLMCIFRQRQRSDSSSKNNAERNNGSFTGESFSGDRCK